MNTNNHVNTNRHSYKFAYSAVTVAVAVMLTACGGGGGSGGVVRPSGSLPPSIPEVPSPPPVPPVNPPEASAIPQPQYTPSNAAIGEELPDVFPSTHRKNNLALGMDKARAQGLDGSGVVVGVVDGGIDKTNDPEFAGAGKLTLGVNHQAPPASDDHPSHGRRVSIIAAGANSGVASKARILADGQGGLHTEKLIRDTANAGASIINISMGNKDTGQDLQEFYTAQNRADIKAAANKGALMVFAIGNDSMDIPNINMRLPQLDSTLQPNIIGVGAVTKNKALESYSNKCGYAAQYCMVSYGTYTSRSDDGNAYATGSGTSDAAPAVSGAAALLKQKYPWASADFLRTTLLTTAEDLGAAGVDSTFGWGLLDVGKAINGPSALPFGNLAMNVTPGEYFLTNAISGTGGIEKSGTGRLHLNGDNTFTGATAVNGGELFVNAKSRSAVTVGTAGTLNGYGVINAAVTNNGVTDFTNSLKVDSYTQSATGTARVALGNTVQVNNQASLDGTLEIARVRNGYVTAGGVTETILRAGSVTGTFATVDNKTSVLIDGTPVYDPTTVKVNLARVSTPRAASVTTVAMQEPSRAAVMQSAGNVERLMQQADAIVQAGGPTNSRQAQLLEMAQTLQGNDAITLNPSLYSLSASVYGNAAAMAALQNSRMVQVMQKGMHNTKDASGNSVFMQGFHSSNTWKPDAALHGDMSVNSMAAGASHAINNKWTVGAALTAQRLDWDETFNGTVPSKSRTDSVGAAFAVQYGNRQSGYAQAFAAYNHLDIDVKRTILLGAGISSNVQNKTSGNILQAGIAGGKEFVLKESDTGRFTLTPEAGVRLDRVHVKGFSEQGAGGAGFTAVGDTFNTPVASFDLTAGWDFLKGSVNFSLGLEHDMRSRSMLFNGAFTGFGTTMQAEGWSIPRTRYHAGLGFVMQVTRNVSIGLEYQREQARSRLKTDRVNAGLKVTF